MTSCKIIIALTVIFIESVLANQEDLWCCPPGSGQFQYHGGGSNASCWDETSNTTNPIRLTCPSFYLLRKNRMNVTFSEYGDILFISPSLDESEKKKPEEVCFANHTSYSFNEVKELILVCVGEEEKEHSYIIDYCISISAVFLLLTSVVYAVLPEIRDLQGKSIVNFCGSLGIGFGILAANNLLPFINMTMCMIRGFAIYFFLVAAFFWSNAIAVQILQSLREPVTNRNNNNWKQFSWYAIYAWGSPTLLTLYMASVNFRHRDHEKPGIGVNSCWFSNKKQEWYYMYSVMAILISVNLYIFIYISVYLTIKLWRLSVLSYHFKAVKYRFVMILRMFFIMVVPWILEMISSLVEHSVISFIIDLFDALQGPLIFLLLVIFNKQVAHALLKRRWMACVARPIQRYLVITKDDQEEVIQHSTDVTMKDRNKSEANGI